MVGLIGGISNQKGYSSIYSKEQNTKPETPRYFILKPAAENYEIYEFRTNLDPLLNPKIETNLYKN